MIDDEQVKLFFAKKSRLHQEAFDSLLLLLFYHSVTQD